MIFLDYLYAFPNSTTPDAIATDIASAVPGFIPLFLLFVWGVVFLGGVSRQKARTGTADYPMWSVTASLSIFMLTLIMSVIPGFINLNWLAVVIVITIFSGVWLFLDKKINEG